MLTIDGVVRKLSATNHSPVPGVLVKEVVAYTLYSNSFMNHVQSTCEPDNSTCPQTVCTPEENLCLRIQILFHDETTVYNHSSTVVTHFSVTRFIPGLRTFRYAFYTLAFMHLCSYAFYTEPFKTVKL